MADLHALLPPLGTLVHFEAASRLRNFSRAADELHFSQATVSRRISELEADLGVALFTRHRYDVEPTQNGELLAKSVSTALRELSATADLIRQRSSDTSTLTIFSDLSLATALVAPILGGFQRTHPEVSIRMLSSYEPIAETREVFDIGLQYGPNEPDAYDVEAIADDTVFPVCSPTFASQLSSPVTSGTLADLPLLHVAYDDPDWTDWPRFLAHVGGTSAEPDDGMTFTSYQVCLDLVERGEGVALGWARTVQPRINAGQLVRLSSLTMPHPNIINACMPRTGAPHPLADAFLSILKAALKPLSIPPAHRPAAA